MINNDHNHNHSDDESERQRLLQSLPVVPLNENILPLPGGRRAHTLTDYSQPDSKERQAMIDQIRKGYTDELEQMDTLDDPLEVCIRYLRWITDTFPTGDNEESKLYDVLRSTCLRFQEDTRYTSDLRYLKCWLDLANHTDEPKDIYEFLMQKGIGQQLALFYEKYSMYYEEREKYKEGRLVLEQGIERMAQPVARLELALEQYIARTKSDQAQPSRSSLLPSTSSRKVLGVKIDPKLRESMSEASYNSIQNSLASSSTSTGGLSRGLSGRSLGNASPLQRRSREFYVATDNTSDQASTSATIQEDLLDRVFPPAPSSPTHTPKASSTRFSRHPQENRPAVEKIAGSTMPMDQNYVRPSKSQFDICRDEDDDAPPAHQPHLDSTPSSSSAQSTTPTPPTLRNIPNMHPDEHAALLESRYRHKGHLYLNTTDSSGNPQRVAALAECLGGPASKPMSFAELRLIRQVDRNGVPQTINGKVREKPSLPIANVPGRLGRETSPTQEFTTETFEAMKTAGESVGGHLIKEDDEDNEESEARQPKRSKHVFVDENQ